MTTTHHVGTGHETCGRNSNLGDLPVRLCEFTHLGGRSNVQQIVVEHYGSLGDRYRKPGYLRCWVAIK